MRDIDSDRHVTLIRISQFLNAKFWHSFGQLTSVVAKVGEDKAAGRGRNLTNADSSAKVF